MSMNIYVAPGTKIVFSNPNAGYPSDQEQCRKLLTEGGIYTVDYIDIDRSSTKIELVEFPRIRFNSVMFNNIPKLNAYYTRMLKEIRIRNSKAQGTGGDVSILLAIIDKLLEEED